MYKLLTIQDTIRIPPSKFQKDMRESALAVLRGEYENRINPDYGVVVAVTDVKDIGEGRVIHGDGATYHDITFEMLAFKPLMHETVRGKVSDITEFGSFVKIGPIDGLVHVSQITDDFISYNEKTGALTGKESNKVLKVGDAVRAKVVTISLKETVIDSKIGLTMRQPGLGKDEWIVEEKTKKTKKPAAKGEKK